MLRAMVVSASATKAFCPFMVISSYGEARLRLAARRITADAGGRFGLK
jgi:hypothetical protein